MKIKCGLTEAFKMEVRVHFTFNLKKNVPHIKDNFSS
jgi:hypothetical protein